ncbi:class I SAM-dependent methyltransferase [Billgrantia montanilacus]|uniref:Methyltransferase domain-containing protein n=1 Tax=Billgrantia montanilacus TaxID=2282305 RepID=A0A368U2Y4_9GAMM|nr:class I SAM-dependent methyltransferase [Halomonas montanilacus]RCV90916.1 methyltransferase domain-containing protein [Halomonas montanilacus]
MNSRHYGALLNNTFLHLGFALPSSAYPMAAEAQGIPVLREFFGEALGRQLAGEGRQADLIIGNNVYAHVSDINDFTRGFKATLKPGGTIILKFPHLMRLFEYNQFDTSYHERISYLSLYTVSRLFQAAGQRVWQVEEFPTHGGSLRVYDCHADDPKADHASVAALLNEEAGRGPQRLETCQSHPDRIKNDLLAFLVEQQRNGKKVTAYGAANKGNTLFNYAVVKPDLLAYVCDAAPAKKGKYMPGSHIPILTPEYILEIRPDYVLILYWSIAEEIGKLSVDLVADSIRFATAVPESSIQ